MTAATIHLRTPMGGDVVAVLAWDRGKREATVVARDAHNSEPGQGHWVQTYRDTELMPAVDGKRQDELLADLTHCIVDPDGGITWYI